MDQNIPDQFFEKLRLHQQTGQDHLQFTEWMRSAPAAEVEKVLSQYSWYFESLADERHPEAERLIALIENRIDQSEAVMPDNIKRIGAGLILKRISVAAAIMGMICFVYYGLQTKQRPERLAKMEKSSDKIVPGGNKAVLTLANGTTIDLNSAQNGLLANQSNVNIYKAKNGQLVYEDQGNIVSDNAGALNTVATPRGGQYQLVLPDGTRVWLNAASSLSYPARFTGGERLVKLTGEAYFEVAKDKKHPFKVSVNDLQVEVLGTHFNIMGYADESAIRTTLLEGSVKILKGAQQQLIVPGEQAIVKDGISVAHVNVNEAVEWKNGNFNFAHEKLETIMRKISRWYDVNIQYEGKTPGVTFVGTIPRSQNIREVLKYLELTGFVHFKIEERRVIVMP